MNWFNFGGLGKALREIFGGFLGGTPTKPPVTPPTKPPVNPPPVTPPPVISPPVTPPTGDQRLTDLLTQHNFTRSNAGLGTLKVNAKLAAAAQKHAVDMASHGMSHTGSDGSSPFDRMRQEGYNFRTAGENVAEGYRDVPSVMGGWMNSPGHKANILSRNYTEVGFGVAQGPRGVEWVACFGAPMSASMSMAHIKDYQVHVVSADAYMHLSEASTDPNDVFVFISGPLKASR